MKLTTVLLLEFHFSGLVKIARCNFEGFHLCGLEET